MVLTLVAAIAVQSPRLSVGATWSGEQTVRYHSKEFEIDETHRYRLSFAITGKENGMWVTQRKSTLLTTFVGGVELPPPPNSTPEERTEWLAPAGFLLDLKPYDKGLFHLDRMLHFWLPSHAPEAWNADISTSAPRSTLKGKAEFQLIGKPAGASRRYNFAYSSDMHGPRAKGVLTFDFATGRLLHAKLDVTGLLIPGGTEVANAAVTYIDSKGAKTIK